MVLRTNEIRVFWCHRKPNFAGHLDMSKRKKSSKTKGASAPRSKAIEFNAEDMHMFAKFTKARREYEATKSQTSSSSSFMTSAEFKDMMGSLAAVPASGTGPGSDGAPAPDAEDEGASALASGPEPPDDVVPSVVENYKAMWDPESTVPLRGHYQEESYHAINIGRQYDAKLKAFVDNVMRFALRTYLSPGITITKQKPKSLDAWFRHIATKMPQGCFRAERNRSSVKARLRAKLQRYKAKRSLGASAPPKVSILHTSLHLCWYHKHVFYLFRHWVAHPMIIIMARW